MHRSHSIQQGEKRRGDKIQQKLIWASKLSTQVTRQPWAMGPLGFHSGLSCRDILHDSFTAPRVFSRERTEWIPTKRLCRHLRAERSHECQQTLRGAFLCAFLCLFSGITGWIACLRPNTTSEGGGDSTIQYNGRPQQETAANKLHSTRTQLICSFSIEPITSTWERPTWFFFHQYRHVIRCELVM